MCGRFTQTQSAEIIAAAFQLAQVPTLELSYNIAPSQSAATVLKTSTQTERQLEWLTWGLVPSWAKEKKLGARLINARAETVAEKPAFRTAFRRRRCLVLADGFYEWQTSQTGKQPFYFHLQDHQPFAFAGLWEQWQPPTGSLLQTFTILTTSANTLLQAIHHRMPVILQPQDYDLWLDPEITAPEVLQPFLQPYSAEAMAAYPVSTAVNRPTHNKPECIEPLPSSV
jgi:putative SOS response-associated peptidase YedK